MTKYPDIYKIGPGTYPIVKAFSDAVIPTGEKHRIEAPTKALYAGSEGSKDGTNYFFLLFAGKIVLSVPEDEAVLITSNVVASRQG